MRIVRFAANGKVRHGVLEENVVRGFPGSPFPNLKRLGSSPSFDGTTYKLDEVKLLAPCFPSKIVCLGLNYRSHVEETKLNMPSVPLVFLKPSTAIIGPEDEVILPRLWRRVDYEGELGVVIGRKAKDVSEDKAKEYVMGYTCFNDISERHDQMEDGQWTRAKSYDTFAPIGPCIETEVDADDLKLETRLNGELRQSARTSDLIFGVSKLISFISGIMTLLPGDVIATGTPSGIGRLNPGDIVEVTIEQIGTLRNPVVDRK
ncbi:MAG: fumarylacetoacetate hydrolase family protein [Dehalococcoidia bacterium]|nr:fumarylacetoacetate hydrolase family protein [Dehalococcoidia bacterium]